MNEQYREFYRLKKEIINNLISIGDGNRMDSYSDNFLEDKTNAEAFTEAKEMMKQADELMQQLVEHESMNQYC